MLAFNQEMTVISYFIFSNKMGQINRYEGDNEYTPTPVTGPNTATNPNNSSGAPDQNRYNFDESRYEPRQSATGGAGGYNPMQGGRTEEKPDLYSVQAQAMQAMQDPYKPVTHSGAANALNQFNRDAAYNSSRSMGSGLLGNAPEANRGMMSYSTSSAQRYEGYGGR